LQGISGVIASGTNLSLAINQGGGTKNGLANTTVADFAANPLVVPTGPVRTSPWITRQQRKLLRARGALAVGFGSFFNASGTFDFERSTLNLAARPRP